MIVNLFLGFIIPWILGLYLFFKDRKILFVISPFMSTMSFAINVWGFHNQYWSMKPYEYSTYSSLPFDIGLYPIFASYLIYFIHNKKFNPYLLVVLVSTLTLIEELCAVYIGRIVYYNGWNGFFTFISYLIPYSLCYCYYLKLKRLHVFT